MSVGGGPPFLAVVTRKRVGAFCMERITEGMVSRAWRSELLRGRRLMSAAGEPVEVVHPGRRNRVAGPDFHHAVVGRSGVEVCGDVEVHVRSSAWRAHGHHRDAEYNGVILHVVMWDDAGGETVRADGGAVPVVALHPLVGAVSELATLAVARERCWNAAQRLGDGVVGEVLDAAGDQRFRSKVCQYGERLEENGADQTLYEGLLRALGYGCNTVAFEELARRVPLRVVERRAGGADVDALERRLRRALNREAGRLSWCVCGTRPANMPWRRIAAGARLLAGAMATGGLARRLVRLVGEADVTKGHRGLEQALMVRDGGSGASIGRVRAREMVVNVLLPFACAWEGEGTRAAGHAVELYRGYPRLGENHITRHMMEQTNAGSWLVRSARRQQGLLHLYHTACLEFGCAACPLT